MKLTTQPLTIFLYATQGIGIAFVGVFLAAYLAGLPSTAVLHSDPTVRLALAALGVTFLVLILVTAVLGLIKRNQ